MAGEVMGVAEPLTSINIRVGEVMLNFAGDKELAKEFLKVLPALLVELQKFELPESRPKPE